MKVPRKASLIVGETLIESWSDPRAHSISRRGICTHCIKANWSKGGQKYEIKKYRIGFFRYILDLLQIRICITLSRSFRTIYTINVWCLPKASPLCQRNSSYIPTCIPDLDCRQATLSLYQASWYGIICSHWLSLSSRAAISKRYVSSRFIYERYSTFLFPRRPGGSLLFVIWPGNCYFIVSFRSPSIKFGIFSGVW